MQRLSTVYEESQNFRRTNASSVPLRKVGYRHTALLGKTLLVELYTLDFMKRICFKIAFATIRAGYNRHVLYNQDVLALAIRPGNSADLCAFLPTNVTFHTLDAMHANVMRLLL